MVVLRVGKRSYAEWKRLWKSCWWWMCVAVMAAAVSDAAIGRVSRKYVNLSFVMWIVSMALLYLVLTFVFELLVVLDGEGDDCGVVNSKRDKVEEEIVSGREGGGHWSEAVLVHAADLNGFFAFVGVRKWIM